MLAALCRFPQDFIVTGAFLSNLTLWLPPGSFFFQPHLKKCYEAVNKLTFEPDLAMTAMISGEGETVPFTKKLYPKGGVEYATTTKIRNH